MRVCVSNSIAALVIPERRYWLTSDRSVKAKVTLKRTILRIYISLLIFPLAYFFIPVDAWAYSVQCECVRALRELQGVNIKNDANKQIPNISMSQVEAGDVVIFSYPENRPPNDGHVALVLEVISEPGMAYLSIVEYNYVRCSKGYRTIEVVDPTIRGILRV